MSDNISITEGSGKTVATDDVGGFQYQRIKPAFGPDGSATDVSSVNPLPVTIGSTGTSIGVYFDQANPNVKANAGTGTFNVAFDPGHELGSLKGINSSIAVYFDRANPSVSIASFTGSLGVYFDRSNPAVTANAGTGTFNVAFSPATPTVLANIISGQTGVAAGSGVTGVTTQRFVQAVDTISSVSIVSAPAFALNSGVVGATTQRVVHAADVGTSINIVAQGLAFLNVAHTAGIFTVSGSTSTSGNNTIVAGSANYNFKVFAYSIQSTGICSIVPRFTSGASGGGTDFWRPLITPVSASATSWGANLAVSAPSYIFATGTSTTLSLYLDTGSLVHYSVSYIKETA